MILLYVLAGLASIAFVALWFIVLCDALAKDLGEPTLLFWRKR